MRAITASTTQITAEPPLPPIIIDDLMKAHDAQSSSKLEQTFLWFQQSLVSRLDHQETGVIIVVMQRPHPDDLAGRLMEQGAWTILNLPAIAEADSP